MKYELVRKEIFQWLRYRLEEIKCIICSIKKPFRYFYRLMSGPEPLSTFEKDRAWHVPEELDLLAMEVR